VHGFKAFGDDLGYSRIRYAPGLERVLDRLSLDEAGKDVSGIRFGINGLDSNRAVNIPNSSLFLSVSLC
jgi:hypothetical protein